MDILPSYLLWRPHLTVCAQCDVIMTSEFVWDELDQRITEKAIKQWHTRLKLRACIEAKGSHFEHKL